MTRTLPDTLRYSSEAAAPQMVTFGASAIVAEQHIPSILAIEAERFLLPWLATNALCIALFEVPAGHLLQSEHAWVLLLAEPFLSSKWKRGSIVH